MTFTDISLDRDKKLINDKFDFILQEISILFDTAPGEVLGDPAFGTEFEDLIWDMNISNNEISSYIKDAIIYNTVSGNYFDINVNTNILYGSQNDIIIVSIEIRDPESNDVYNLTYKID